MTALSVDAVGAFTSVGLDMAQTAISLRTRLQRFAELDLEGPDREPLIGAATPFPLSEVRGVHRLLALGVPALCECSRGQQGGRAPMLVCVPDTISSRDAAPLLPALADAAGVGLDAASRLIPGGRSGVLEALVQAEALLDRDGAEACYVGGLDSLVDDEALLRGVEAQRVKHTENPNGYVPGEAAAFLRISKRTSPRTLAIIRGVGVAAEAVTRASGKQSSGAGLARAMEAALAGAGAQGRDISWLVHDCAGERYDFQELALAVARLALERTQTFVQGDAATSVGEVGVAAGALALAYVAFGMRHQFAPGPGAMVIGRSEVGRRAAAFLTTPTPGRG